MLAADMNRVLWLGLLPTLLVAAVLQPAAAQTVPEPSASPTERAEARIVRIAGLDRVATAIEASRHAFPDGADTVVLAGADRFPDGIAAAPLAAAEDGPLLLVGGRARGAVLDEIRRLGASRAVIVAAYGAVPVLAQLELERAGIEVRRVAGDGRFDTAALIARDVAARAPEVLLASGAHFADALAGAPLAAHAGLPVLLTAPGELLADPAAAVRDLGVESALLLGGVAALDEAVEDAVPGPRRLSGPDRYRTSVAVAEELLARGGSVRTVAVATGLDFADALAAGPVAGRVGAPLLLVHGHDSGQSAAAVRFLRAHRDDIETLLLFGGERAIAPAVRERLAAAIGVSS